MDNRISNFEPFNGELQYANMAFLTEDDKVLWVEKEWADDLPNPREEAKSIFVTFDGNAGAADSPDRDDTPETLDEFAFNMGVSYPDIDPIFNEEGEAVNSPSYGELYEASLSLPEKILDAARENGYTILPVSTKAACIGLGKHYMAGLPEDKFESFTGFIYSTNPEVTEKDLREEVRKYDAYVTFEIYKATEFPLTELGNVDTSSPSESKYFFGYDTAENGFEDIQDVSRYLGEFGIPEDVSQKKNLELIIENDNLAREEISKFDFPKVEPKSMDEVFHNSDPRPVDPVTRQYVGTVDRLRTDENNLVMTEANQNHKNAVAEIKRNHLERFGTEKSKFHFPTHYREAGQDPQI